jgi:hypothetical protein
LVERVRSLCAQLLGTPPTSAASVTSERRARWSLVRDALAEMRSMGAQPVRRLYIEVSEGQHIKFERYDDAV